MHLPTNGSRCAALMIALLLGGCAGCRALQEYWSPTREGFDNEVESDASDTADKDGGKDGTSKDSADKNAASETAAGEKADPAKAEADKARASMIAALAKDGWNTSLEAPGAKPTEKPFRWSSQVLENLLRTPPEKRLDVAAFLDDKNTVIATNAAIVLSRWQQGNPIPQLKAAVSDIELRLPMRRAALEALSHVQNPSPLPTLEGLMAQFGAYAGAAARNYVPELHADMLLALDQCDRGGVEPAWTNGFKSPDPLVRVAALNTWSSQNGGELPPVALELRNDADNRVRIAALHTLGKHRPAKAAEYLRRALDDFDVNVRLAAVESLGQLGTEDARVTLAKLRNNPAEMIRMAAVESLILIGDDKNVAAAASDKSWRVRQVVAQALEPSPGLRSRDPKEASRLAQLLIADRNPQVQKATINALADWPLQEAGSTLFLALRDGGYLVRKTAAGQLTERWPPAADFPIDGASESRAAALDRLQTAWNREFGGTAAAMLQLQTESPGVQLTRLEAEFKEQVESLKTVGTKRGDVSPLSPEATEKRAGKLPY